MYWDDEQKKYFTIRQAHQLPPDSKYSVGAVASQREEARNRAACAAFDARRRKDRVQRSTTLDSPLLAVSLSRELGQHATRPSRADVAARAIGQALDERQWDLPNVATSQEITAFAWDAATSSFVIGARAGAGANAHAHNVVAATTGRVIRERTRADFRWRELVPAVPSLISSVSVSPSRVVAVTSLGDAERATLHLIKLEEPETHRANRPPEALVSLAYRFPAEHTAWTAAPNDLLGAADTVFAVGMSGKVVLYSDTRSDWDNRQVLAVPGDPLALAWLTPTLLAVGQRNGSVRLWDTRTGGSVKRILSGGCVTGIRRVDASQLVVQGLSNSLALHDLRMPREREAPMEPRGWIKEPGRKAWRAPKATTQPAVAFAYRNEYCLDLGFDVSTDLGLVAAADDRNVVQLYSLATGQQTGRREKRTELKRTGGVQPYVRGLRFVEIDEIVGLVGSYGTHLVHWRW